MMKWMCKCVTTCDSSELGFATTFRFFEQKFKFAIYKQYHKGGNKFNLKCFFSYGNQLGSIYPIQFSQIGNNAYSFNLLRYNLQEIHEAFPQHSRKRVKWWISKIDAEKNNTRNSLTPFHEMHSGKTNSHK